jgi:hypothetical protein
MSIDVDGDLQAKEKNVQIKAVSNYTSYFVKHTV